MEFIQNYILPKNFISYILYILVILAIIHYNFFPLFSTPPHEDHNNQSNSYATSNPSLRRCDLSKGRWVYDEAGPLYNGTSCSTIKWAQNCMSNGRPDTIYLHWRWKPNGEECSLPLFNPSIFFELMRNKHLALVGDSLARNQAESLVCLLSTLSRPELVYHDNEQGDKFRKWVFYEYNTTISSFWSPFLVEGIVRDMTESKTGLKYNTLYLDVANEKWATQIDKINMIVFSIGHWFFESEMYYEGDKLLGCSGMKENNCTDYSLVDAFRKAWSISFKEVIKKVNIGSDKAVVGTTFSASHYEGAWDNFGSCSKIEPYKEGEIEVPYGENEMREVVLEEVEKARKEVKEKDLRLKIELLDVTKLAFMRPDGHPGPYMYPNPFKDGKKEKMQNDCLHWCMPGPIDTWNEILLEIIKRWREE
ncbi:hypothetical protein LUZ60_003203 [Juncus effusus]|nr:hypothetical protein LUZ60_003203 [Juncus effusus]